METTTKYDTIINFFLDNWIIATIVVIVVVIITIPQLIDGAKLIKEWYKKQFCKKKEKIISPQYTPCSSWTVAEGDRLRHIDEEMFQQHGVLIVVNKKGDYVFCYVGDPYNMNIQNFKISELTKDGIS